MLPILLAALPAQAAPADKNPGHRKMALVNLKSYIPIAAR
jgi:hypothetical protein